MLIFIFFFRPETHHMHQQVPVNITGSHYDINDVNQFNMARKVLLLFYK